MILRRLVIWVKSLGLLMTEINVSSIPSGKNIGWSWFYPNLNESEIFKSKTINKVGTIEGD